MSAFDHKQIHFELTSSMEADPTSQDCILFDANKLAKAMISLNQSLNPPTERQIQQAWETIRSWCLSCEQPRRPIPLLHSK